MQEDPPFIGDWYRQKKLGSGGFGVVTLWKNQKTQQYVAIKRCHPTTTDAASKITIERWDREVDYMTHRVKHENIVNGLTIKPDSFLIEMNRINPSPMPVLVMEYCECGDLRQQLNANANTSGFGERETRDILRCLGAAIAYLHTLKITHRDIKPENIVIKKDVATGQKVYKLTDLGYAKPLDHKSIVASLVGTLEYIAPELCMTDRYTNSVDYWSLGVIAFEIVTGTRPFAPHLLLAQWINTVKRKSSADICITEDSNGTMIYAQHLPAEHQISSCLAARLEPWLQLALEWNPKQRGHTFKNSTPKTNPTPSDGSTITLPPILELRIFTMLDNILKQRILTVFCLHTYQRLSYEINDASSMSTLKALVAKDTGIAVDHIRFVLHITHPSPLDKVDDRPEAKSIDMYWPDQEQQRPMCYVYSVGDSTKKLDAVKLSSVVSEVLTNRVPVQKPHIIKRFAYDTFYIVRREQRKYIDLFEGLQSLALRLNHEVVLHENEVQRMIRMAFNLEGAMSVVNAFPALPQSGADEPIVAEDRSKIAGNIASVIAACEKISKRYKSLVRRSNETIANRLVVNDKSDSFGVVQLEKDFEILRVQLLKKVSTEKQHQEMMRSVKACGQRRDQLLREKDMVQLMGITGLVLEMEEIHKTLEMGVQQAEKYQREVQEISNVYHARLISAIAETKPTNGDYLPDIVGIGDSATLKNGKQNGTSQALNQSKDELRINSDDQRSFDSLAPPVSFISIADEEAAAALILKNQELRSKFESLMLSLTDELTKS